MKRDKKEAGWVYSDTNGFSADSAAPGHDDLYDEEYAAEVADIDVTPRRVYSNSNTRHEETNTVQNNVTSSNSTAGVWGTVALIAAIASWFVWPTVLAPVGIIAGIVAFIKGRKAIGGWSVAIGIISLILFMIAAF